MPNDYKGIFVDSSFFGETTSTQDSFVSVSLLEDDVIGGYTIPVVYTSPTVTSDYKNVEVAFFVASVDDYNEDIVVKYINSPVNSGVVPALVSFYTPVAVVSGSKNIDVVYSTGYFPVSGTLNKRVDFSAGKRYYKVDDTLVNLYVFESYEYHINRQVDYMNFTGDITTSGTPVAYYDNHKDIINEFNYSESSLTDLNKLVDIFFAGWVNFTFNSDVFASDLVYGTLCDLEITTLSGGHVTPNYLEVYSCGLTTSGINLDLFCSLVDFNNIVSDITTISGSIEPINIELFSSAVCNKCFGFNVDLYSLKIDNFSLAIGEYTEASNYISFDVLDDECPVSVSGTYLTVSGTVVNTTYSGIDNGYRFYYNPEDDFESLLGPTNFKIHAENECGNILEVDYYLLFGYFLEYDPAMDFTNNINYGYGNEVLVRISAEDYATCPTLESLAWSFETRGYYAKDLSASIICGYVDTGQLDLSANIYPQSTAYYYGKEFTVVINAKDFSGNIMEPYVLVYKIEDKPG